MFWLTLDMDDKIDGFCDLGFGVGECALRVAACHEIPLAAGYALEICATVCGTARETKR